MPEGLDPSSWLQLGLGGAALLIVMVVVIMMFKQQSNSIDKLCTKLDGIITSFADNNIKLNEVTINNDRDQKELIRCFHTLNDIVQDMHKRVIRIDTRLYEQRKYDRAGQSDVDKEDNLQPLKDYSRVKGVMTK